MFRVIIYVIVFTVSFITKFYGQESFEKRAQQIAVQIEKITEEEKGTLKEFVAQVEDDFKKGKITREEAEQKKAKLAEETATRIEKRLAFQEAKVTELIKDKVEGRIEKTDTVENKWTIKFKNSKKKMSVTEKRTTSQPVFAMGINNVVTNGSVANSDFRYWGSHFYEIGLTFNTRILKNDNALHFKYGLSLQYNNLRATNNRLFVENEGKTNLENSNISLKDSRFRTHNLVMPLYLEFDLSKKGNVKDHGKTHFMVHQGFRFGLGGFVGAKLGAKQVLEYDDVNGNSVETEARGGFNTNDFVYGLGTYIGYKDTSLFLKYDLNPVFKNNSVTQNNISLGVRFDIN
ncbi:MAG: hypothetical protein QM535_00285 [Limnohabitans sp.]|nr:hypothetical protein [Limnohabitans sp.]